ncbi:unnamed protein product, partial [Phaeothamnion confervicola]
MATCKGPKLSNEQRLRVYAFYKQATLGDCLIQRPSVLDIVGRAKWDAWQRVHGLPELEAKMAYITTEIKPDWLKTLQSMPPRGSAGSDSEGSSSDGHGGDKGRGRGDGGGAGLSFSVAVSTMALEDGEDTSKWDSCEALFEAASFGDCARVEALAAAGMAVNGRDPEGRAPLHFACDRRHEAARALLRLGADVDARDADGQTALAYAVACGHRDVIQVLVDAGADVSAEDDDGDTPLGTASAEMRAVL